MALFTSFLALREYFAIATSSRLPRWQRGETEFVADSRRLDLFSP
jgi:hypothetical protein